MKFQITDKISMTVEHVGPEIALQYLEANTSNRPLSENKVKVFVHAMKNHQWRLTHQGIAFDENGALQDGQKRLTAIVKAGIPQTILVFRGMPPTNFTVVDSNEVRTPAHGLAIKRVKNYKEKASFIRFILFYLRGAKLSSLSMGGGGHHVITNDEIVDFCIANIDRVNETFERCEKWLEEFGGHIETRFICSLYWLFSEEYPTESLEFFEALSTGANLDSTSPILKLRNALLKDTNDSKKMSKASKVAIIIKAFRLFINGETIEKLYWSRKTEKFPEIPTKINKNLIPEEILEEEIA